MRLEDVYVRPGVGATGVGLICLRRVPRGALICCCEAKHSKTVPTAELAAVDPEVRTAVHEMFDGLDVDGTCTVPNDYDQNIPLISFINHSASPNCVFDSDDNCIRSARWLRKGEEATVDYTKYQHEGSYALQYARTGFARRPMVGY